MKSVVFFPQISNFFGGELIFFFTLDCYFSRKNSVLLKLMIKMYRNKIGMTLNLLR